jgi:glucokinase
VAARHDRRVIGLLDIGGTKLAAAVADGGELGPVLREPTPAGDPAGALIGVLERSGATSTLSGVGVAVPGPFERDARALANPPGMPPIWRSFHIGDALADRFGCPVWVENDANCAALAEAVSGAGKADRTVVYFTVSTGVGTGVVRDRKVVVSRHDTEGGHQVLWPEWLGGPPCHCGGAGCLESLASGRAIEKRFGVRGEHLRDAAAWEDVGRWLGLGVVNATALLDPDVVVFGGGVCASWDRFASALLDTVGTHVKLQPPPRVCRGELAEEERNLLGALALATEGARP